MADKSDGSGDVAGDHIEELNGIDSVRAGILKHDYISPINLTSRTSQSSLKLLV